MEGNMKVAIMTDVMKMDFTERPIPQPKDDEVLVKIEHVGVCGSDLHYFEAGGIGRNIVHPPFVLGHEAGGTVVEVGKNVTHLKVGDKVALEPGKTCGHCEFCKTGRYNLCPDVIFFATPPIDGVFQEYVAHEAALALRFLITWIQWKRLLLNHWLLVCMQQDRVMHIWDRQQLLQVQDVLDLFPLCH